MDGDCDFGVIPKEIIVLYTADKYSSTKIMPIIGSSYFSYQKSLFFNQCNPKKCYQLCDKSSHHDRFNLTLVEDNETAIEIIKILRENVNEAIFIMDVKLSTKDKTEKITYTSIFFPNSDLKSKFISFNLEKIANSHTVSKIVEFLFSTKKNYVICTDFPYAKTIGLLNRLNNIVEAAGEKCSIPRYFPKTWEDAYKYKGVNYTNYSDNEVEEVHSDDEITVN